MTLFRPFPLFASLCLAATGAMADPLTIDTATGPVTLTGTPETLAVYDVAAIDTLDALGVTIAGTPSPLLVPDLQEVVGSATGIGTLFEPDYEALARLAPDLIIVGGRSSKQLKPVGRVAPAVDVTLPADDLVGGALARLETYGRLMGLEDKAEELRIDLQAKLDAARAAVDGKGKALVILTNGPKISAYGAGSRFGWLHTALNLPEARPGLSAQTHGEAVSFEFIAEVDPDWLVVVDRGVAVQAEGESASQTLDNALVQGTKAWKNGHVVYLNPARVYIAGGGVQAMGGTLDEITAAFGASDS